MLVSENIVKMATKNSSGNSSGSNSSSGGISDDMRKLLAHQLEIKSWLLEVLINTVLLFICIITYYYYIG